jgi:hypothetical protein
MKNILLILSVLVILVSCEKKVAKAEYDYLLYLYTNKCKEIQYLEDECNKIENYINQLQEDKNNIEFKKSNLEDKIEKAIESAEYCEYTFNFYADKDVVSFYCLRDAIQKVSNDVDDCYQYVLMIK